jgi:CubicO group peptidase (beta-lactamase class C family)
MPMTDVTLNRRAMLRGAALLGAGLAGGALLPGRVLAQGVPGGWYSVDGFIRGYVSARKVPNMVAALGWRQDAPAFVAHGTDSFTTTRLSDADSLYRIYSMTKPITGMAAMMLVDEGKIALDQPIAEVLPAFARMQVQKVADGAITPDNLEPAVRPITLRQLLTHTAGLGYGIVQEGPLSDAYRERGLVPGQVSRLEMPGTFRGTPAESLEIFADRLAEMPLVYQPGTRWSYSVGLDLVGRLIEVLSGMPFDRFLKTRIFDPCGMTSTWFQVPESEKHRLTANYFLLDTTLLPIDLGENSIYLDAPAFPYGGAGLVSTARDYDRFLAMLAGYGALDGTRVMSEAAVRLGTSNLFPATLSPDDAYAKSYDFGAGGRVGRGEEAGIYGWFGAAGTCGLVDMRHGLRHTLMTQYMPATAYPVYGEFPAAVARDAAAQRAA